MAKQSIYNTKVIDWRLFIMEGCVFVSKVFTFFEWFSLFLREFIWPFSWFAVGTRAPASKLKESIVREYREKERQKMQKTLDDYLLICRQMGVINPSLLISIHFFLLICSVCFGFKEFVSLKQKPWSYVWNDGHF